MPLLSIHQVFQELVPQELKEKYFSEGVLSELNIIDKKRIFKQIEIFKSLSCEARLQLIILLNFTPKLLNDEKLSNLVFSLDIPFKLLSPLLPYLQRQEALIEYFKISKRPIRNIKVRPDDYFFYFLNYQQTELINYFVNHHLELIEPWIEQNHEYVIEFCLETDEISWFEILLPLIRKKTLADYFNLHEHLFYDKRFDDMFRLFVLELRYYHPELLKDFLCADQFSYLITLIHNGAISFFKDLFVFLEDEYQTTHPNLNFFKFFLYSQKFRAIHHAAEIGNQEFFDWIIHQKASELPKILKHTQCLALKLAVAHHHSELFHFLLSQVDLKTDLINASIDFDDMYYDGSILNIALAHGNQDLLDEIYALMCLSYTPHQLFYENEDDLFLSAVEGGQIQSLDWLFEKALHEFQKPDFLNELVRRNFYSIILEAADNGNLDILAWLDDHLDKEVFKESFFKFKHFFKKENQIEQKLSLPILDWLEIIFEERVLEILTAENYASLMYAIQFGQADIIGRIFDILQKNISQLPQHIQRHALEMALMSQSTPFLDLIKSQLSLHQIKNLVNDFEKSFIKALMADLKPISLEWLREYDFSYPLRISRMSSRKTIFQELMVDLSLKKLKEMSIKELRSMIVHDNSIIFKECIYRGELKCLKYLSQTLPQTFSKGLARHYQSLLKTALYQEEFRIFEFLLQEIQKTRSLRFDIKIDVTDWLSLIFARENLSSVIWCFETGLIDVEQISRAQFKGLVQDLMHAKSQIVLDYVFPFIQERIKANLLYFCESIDYRSEVEAQLLKFLFQDMTVFLAYEKWMYTKQPKPYGHLDFFGAYVAGQVEGILSHGLDEDNLLQTFHYVRYGIAHSRITSLVLQVLAEPNFQMIASSHENILLRLALRANDKEIIELLLQIEEVKLLAEQHQFYTHEQVIDVGEESAMRPLGYMEMQGFQAVKNYYLALIGPQNLDHIFHQLKTKLHETYEQSPARIQWESQEMTLPLKYEDFEAKKLPEVLKLQALEAYYQHTMHTAYRFLSMPNHWLHPDIDEAFLHVDEEGRRSAAFQGYISLIAILFYAASDEHMKPTDGHTMDSRWKHFCMELALAGRAHNCEKKITIQQADGSEIEHEVDDLEADKPTCARGLLAHLSQSVLGHPLFKQLSFSMVKSEFNAFIYRYYHQVIDAETAHVYQDAFETYCVELDASSLSILKRLDIPMIKQAELIHEMKSQYQHQFTAHFEKWVMGQFKLTEKDAHAIYFYQTCLKQILERFLHKRKASDEEGAAKKSYRSSL